METTERSGPKVLLRWFCRWALLEQLLSTPTQPSPDEKPLISLRETHKLLDFLFEMAFSQALMVHLQEQLLEDKANYFAKDSDLLDQMAYLRSEPSNPYKFVENLTVRQARNWVQSFGLSEVLNFWNEQFRRYEEKQQGTITPMRQYWQQGLRLGEMYPRLAELYPKLAGRGPSFDERKRWKNVHQGPLLRRVRQFDSTLAQQLGQIDCLGASDALRFAPPDLRTLIIQLMNSLSLYGEVTGAIEAQKTIPKDRARAFLDDCLYPRDSQGFSVGALLLLGSVYGNKEYRTQLGVQWPQFAPEELELFSQALLAVVAQVGWGAMGELLPQTHGVLAMRFNCGTPPHTQGERL